MPLRLRRLALTVHVEHAMSEVVPERGAEEPQERAAASDPDAMRAELERMRRDSVRTAAEGYGD